MLGPQQDTTSQRRSFPWWVKLCQRLWKAILGLGIFSMLVSLAGNLFSTWLTSSKGVIPADSPWEGFSTMVRIHWLTALLMGFCLVLFATLIWSISRWSTRETEIYPPAPQDRARMLRRLRLRYEQMLEQSLQGTVQIELGLASRSAAVQQVASLALRLPGQADQLLPPHTSIVEAYNLAQQELLILGEPGAGKSTLLLELAHHLTGQAEQDATCLLPVLLPLSSWAVKRLSLQDWLAEQIATLYNMSPYMSLQWVQTQQFLPLLDGLDEMEEAARPLCITAINTYHREHLGPLVVCSRTSEYESSAKHEQLALHNAVIVQALPYSLVDAHLATLGKPLVGLRTALRKQHLLRSVATTPLMLQILMLTYHGVSIRELQQKESLLYQQIWIDYVQRMVERKGNAKRYSFHTTLKRLQWLALEMRQHNQTIFSLEQIQPNWLPKKQRVFYRWSVVLFFWLVFGPVTGLVSGLIGGLVVNSTIGVIIGLLFELFIGLLSGLNFGLSAEIKPTEVLTWPRKNLRIGLSIGLAVGLISGLQTWQQYGLMYGLLVAPLSSLAFALIVVIFIGVYGNTYGNMLGLLFTKRSSRQAGKGLLNQLLHASRASRRETAGEMLERIFGSPGKRFTERETLSPNEGIQRSLKNGMLVFGIVLFFGLGIGMLAGIRSGLSDKVTIWSSELATGIAFGFVCGLGAGIVCGLIYGLGATTQHYILRLWLASSGSLPWRAIPFLQDATARILLRRISGGYIFTHRLLLDFLADSYAGVSLVQALHSLI